MEPQQGAMPACAWDTRHGVVVLYRHHGRPEEQRALALVVEPADGGAPYFAGDFLADRLIWAVRAPRAGRFRLAFHALGPPARMDAEAPLRIAFNDQLQVEHTTPIGPGQRLMGWLFRRAGAGRRPGAEPLRGLDDGKTLADLLREPYWDPGERVGIAIARYTGHGGDLELGPAFSPQRGGAVQQIPVAFELFNDSHPLPEDSVRVIGFRVDAPNPVTGRQLTELQMPGLVVDLSAFGERAESVRHQLVFIHRPHGPEARFLHLRGSDLELHTDGEGRCWVAWACDSGCLLDLIGVFYAGGEHLTPAPSRTRGLELYAHGQPPDTQCLLAQFFGSQFRLLPTHAADYAAWAREALGPLDMTEVELQLFSAWVTADERLREADWRGAEDAEAFTLLAYAEVLGLLLDASASARADLPQLLDRHGIGFRSFAAFERRPDVALAIAAMPRVQALLRRPRLAGAALLDAAPRSPVAALAAALEPDAAGLPGWIEDQPPSLQRAVWLFLLAGGKAEHWHRLGLAAAAADTDLRQLAQRLQVALAPIPPYIAAGMEDLGEDPARLRPPRDLDEAEARLALMQDVGQALTAELTQASTALGRLHAAWALDPVGISKAFGAALEARAVPDLAQLRRRVLNLMPGLVASGGAAVEQGLALAVAELTALAHGVRTRLALWGLAQALEAMHAAPASMGPAVESAADAEPASAPTPLPSPQSSPAPAPTPRTVAAPRAAPALHANPPGAAATSPPPPATATAPENDWEGGFGFEPVAANDGFEPGAAEVGPPAAAPASAAPSDLPFDAGADHRGLLMAWCHLVLRRQAWAFPPRMGLVDAAGLDLDQIEVELEDAEDYWGLLDHEQPLALPPWQGARAGQHRELHADILAGAERAADWLRRASAAGGEDLDGLSALIGRIAAAAEQIAADALWDGIKGRAESAIGGERGALIAELRARMGAGPPARWEALAAELDDLLAVSAADGQPGAPCTR